MNIRNWLSVREDGVKEEPLIKLILSEAFYSISTSGDYTQMNNNRRSLSYSRKKIDVSSKKKYMYHPFNSWLKQEHNLNFNGEQSS